MRWAAVEAGKWRRIRPGRGGGPPAAATGHAAT